MVVKLNLFEKSSNMRKIGVLLVLLVLPFAIEADTESLRCLDDKTRGLTQRLEQVHSPYGINRLMDRIEMMKDICIGE